MEIFTTSAALQAWRGSLKAAEKTLGFVPTMGALHSGHISLVQQALKETHCCLVSIFVNPLQFNNGNDLDAYPRMQQADIELLKSAGCHAVYIPDFNEVYGNAQAKTYALGSIEHLLEGAFRPGHFQGVANVIDQLFQQTQPDAAFFGLKDFQQFLIIQQFSKQFFPNIRIVGCPTLRDSLGLAQSSRNLRLSPSAYQQAVEIPAFLLEIPKRMQDVSFADLSNELQQRFEHLPELRLEYFSLHRADTLERLQHFDFNLPMVIFIAFYAGNVRLIDNVFC